MNGVVRKVILALGLCCCFAGCGGGGGSSAPPPTTAPTKAILTLSSQGTLAPGISMSGIGVTVNFPPGVTVKTDSNGAVSTGVVVPSGVVDPNQSIISPPVYTPASSTALGELGFTLASSQPAGFSTGEFVTINCDITPGASPKPTDFTITEFSPVDLDGVAISGLSGVITVHLE